MKRSERKRKSVEALNKADLADEPTGNLDEENRMEIMKLLAELNRNGMTIIMVTHDMDLLQYATRVCKMSDGRLV